MPASDAETTFDRFVAALAPQAMQVELGFYPRAELPAAILVYIQTVQPTVRDFSSFVQGEMADVAAIQTAVTALNADFLVAAVGMPIKTNTDKQTLVTNNTPLPATVRTGKRHTAATALMRLLWAALALAFKYAGAPALTELLKLGQPGCQGTAAIVTWQHTIAERLQYVSHMADVQPTTGHQIFLNGLNNPQLTQQGWNIYNAKLSISLADLALELQQLKPTCSSVN